MESLDVISKTKWAIDNAHSEIGFKVKHLVFANVRGQFKEFDARIYTTGDDFANGEIELSISAASIDTGNEQRNAHLRSADFFDVEQFPTIGFSAQSLVDTDWPGRYELSGELTMKGVTKQIQLEVDFGGVVKDPWGAGKALFAINGKINRKNWGLNYNATLEAGGVLISEDVWIHCEVQLIKEV
jgi:polyisoprenoid-binding protein YceI